MIRELKENQSYTSTTFVFGALATVFGIAFAFWGEIFLPPAAALLALLFVLERPKSRYLSYIAALLPVALAFIVNGIFGLISIEPAILALAIALVYRFNGSKAECAVYATLIVSLFAILSLYLGGAKATGSFSYEIVFDYYSDVITTLKLKLLDMMNYYVKMQGDPAAEVFTVTDATDIAHRLKVQLVSFVAIAAFILVGITIKLFTSIMLKVSKRGILKRFAHFLPSNIISYVYIGVAVLSLLVGYETVLDAVILNVANILSVVFAYLGFQYATTIASASGRRKLAVIVIIASFLIIPTLALRILSFVGVWAAVGINNAMSGKLPPNLDR